MPPGEPASSQAPRWSIDELIPFGKYILLNKLGSGAVAIAYRAKVRGEAGFERIVTIKRVLPQMAGDSEFVETFVREAKICARLTHGNICPIYELGKVGESLYMALQFIAGKDLGAIARRLQSNSKVMPAVAAAWIASRLCDALDYAHGLKDASGNSLGILHQDLSPTNVVISYEGEAKLIDFGIARASGRAQQTNVEALKQKIGYMSPEMVLGGAVDARSDVFGVGVCLYEMVTGRRLFAGADDIATLRMVSSGVVPPPSALLEDTPEELEMIMMRALARDPHARWQSAGEMAQALTACVAAEDPAYGTRHIATLMRELFAEDAAVEQRQLHGLIKASQDPQVLEQRRKFFASPLGAAAVAKADAARKLASARPPAPASEHRTGERAPKLAPLANLPPKPPMLQAPAKPEASPRPERTETAEDELTTYRSEGRTAAPISSSPHSPSDAGALTRAASYEEMTQGVVDDDASKIPTVRPDESASSQATAGAADAETPARAARTARTATASDDEPTTFRPEQALQAQFVARAQAADLEGDPTTLRPEGEAQQDQRSTLPAPKPNPTIAPSAADGRASGKAFEDEQTSYFMQGDRVSDEYTALDEALVVGPFEEEATQILFSIDEEELTEDMTMAIAAGRLRIPPPAGASVTPGGVATSRVRTKSQILHAPLASPMPPAPATAPSGEAAVRVARTIVERGSTHQISIPVPPQRSPILWIAAALVLIAAAGVVANSSLGVTLGLRKPPDGVIEVRTAPDVPASVRLDGIYRGRAPLRLEGVPAGNRVLALEAEGYAPISRLVSLEGGAVVRESVALNPSPPKDASAAAR